MNIGEEKVPFYKSLWFRISEIVILVVVLFLSGFLVYDTNTNVPIESSQFNLQEALAIIKEISKTSHPVINQSNIEVFEYLRDSAYEVKRNSKHEIDIDIQRDDLVFDRDGVNFVVDIRNLIIVVKGESEDCLMISAHYDSKAISHGTFDNSVGVGVAFQE